MIKNYFSTSPGQQKYWVAILLLILIFIVLIAISVGSVPIKIGDILILLKQKLLNVPLNNDQQVIGQIIFEIRLPRVLMAVLIGAALAICGTVFQALFRNPLADPYIIGASSGASLGASLAFISNLAWGIIPLSPIPLFAFLGAMLSSLLVYQFARNNSHLNNSTLLLSGIAISSFLSALTSLLMFFHRQEVPNIMFWLMGNLSASHWQQIGVILPYFLGGFLLLLTYRSELDLLLLGNEKAHYLGLKVISVQKKLIIISSLLVAAAVSTSGTIGFVGLITPHLTRFLTGPSHKYLLPLAALSGSIFLLTADTLARTLLSPTELPVGIITALGGAPFFFYLAAKNNHKN